MKPHPIIDYPFRWIPMLVLALILVATQVVLVCGYTGNDYLPALVDGVATIGWLAAIAYLAWFVVGLVSLFQTDIIMIIVGSLLWLAGSFMICDHDVIQIFRTYGVRICIVEAGSNSRKTFHVLFIVQRIENQIIIQFLEQGEVSS